MLRYSLGALLGAVLVVAVGCAALVNPTPLWSQIVFTVTLFLVLGAAVAAVVSRPRPFAAGFAIFGGCYLLLTCGAWGWSVRSQLLTETALLKLEPLVVDPNQSAAQTLWLSGATFNPGGPGGSSLWVAPNNVYTSYVSYPGFSYPLVVSDPSGALHQIGHSLWAIFFGVVGGAVARLTTRRRETNQAPLPLSPR